MPERLGCSLGLICLGVLLCASGCGSGETPGQSVTASIETENEGNQRDNSLRGPRVAVLQDPKFPTVRITTTSGSLVVELDMEKAPITVKNFLWHINNGHYEGTIFHQVVPGYMALGGGYTEAFKEKPTQFWIRNEAYNGLKNRQGTIAMARCADEADSSTCQFFFNLVDNPHLDHESRISAERYGYCVFGRVVEGIEVLEKIGRTPVTDKGSFKSTPARAVVIEKIVPTG